MMHDGRIRQCGKVRLFVPGIERAGFVAQTDRRVVCGDASGTLPAHWNYDEQKQIKVAGGEAKEKIIRT
jgi:hypothetical protein